MNSVRKNTYVGFGFGAIQSGLFLYEAFKSNPDRRLVVAEIIPQIVSAVRYAEGNCFINIAYPDYVKKTLIKSLEIENPTEQEDRHRLVEAISEATEIGTAVPSVDFYFSNDKSSLHSVIS